MNENDRWKHRRRMAYWSIIAGLVYPFVPIDPELAKVIAYPFYLFVGSVVGSYVGFATVDDKWQRGVEE